MQKATFRSLQETPAGEFEADVWTFVSPWGERIFRQDVKASLGEGVYQCALVPLEGGSLPHCVWWGEHSVAQFGAHEFTKEGLEPQYEVTVGEFTFEGRVRFPYVGKLMFWPDSVVFHGARRF